MATLLLADDSVTIQRVIELTFADEGVRVIAVGDGETAIARMEQERPDIVLADVGMPGVDGYQVARHVKQSPALAQVPVLLLTGAFEPIDEERARETGCDGVLIKTVHELLSGARSAELWPADMPRLDPGSARPAAMPAAPAMSAAPATPATTPAVPAPQAAHVPPPQPAPASAPDAPVTEDGAHLLSVAYEAEADPDLAAALARLEFVAVPEAPDAPVPPDHQAPETSVAPERAALEDPSRAPSLEWDLSAAPGAAGGARPVAGGVNQSLANVFSALLAAERQNPNARATLVASPALTEAAVEEVVQKVVRRMTNELVRKIVLETAERLIREEIARIKA
jgi:CheY-like chemotaxis protein